MFGAYGASADIVSYINVYAWPILCPCFLGLHPINPLMGAMEVGRGTVEQFWAMQTLVPLRSRLSQQRAQPGLPEMSGNAWDLLPALGPTSKG